MSQQQAQLCMRISTLKRMMWNVVACTSHLWSLSQQRLLMALHECINM